MSQRNGWLKLIEENPHHSQWYIDRFRSMADSGTDLAGEARFVDAMVPRGSTILDAGCGTGRVGAFLAAVGHDVVGVDLDPVLIAAARSDHPGSRWLIGDLAELDVALRGVQSAFDAIVCAGNVMSFLAPDTRVRVLELMRAHLNDSGRIAIGFGAGRGYDHAQFLEDVPKAGLIPELLLSSWDLRPYTAESDFIVALLGAG